MTSGRLPFCVPPQPDELLSSWLVRLAHAHECKVYTFTKVLFPETSVWNRDVDKAAPAAVLDGLTERTPSVASRIHATTLRSYEGRLYLQHNPYGNTDWVLPLGIYHRTRRRYGLLFCPGCLRRDGATPYYRTHWRLALSLACPECGLCLHDHCPNCQAPVIFFRIDLGHKLELPDVPISHCFRCGFDLARAEAVGAPASIIRAQLEWERILTEGWTAAVGYPHLYFGVLHQLVRVLSSDKPACSPLQQALARQAEPSLPEMAVEQLRAARSFEHLPFDARCTVLLQAHWLLTEWPHRFVSFMKHHRIASTPLLQGASPEQVPFWYSSVVREQLYVNNVNRRFPDFWA
ncbi:TniQ family protein [Hymenobacter agri]